MHPVVVITAASGGLGVSTLAAVTATVLARDSSPTLVDAAFGAGGLDATIAAEHVDGLR
jgi:septum formation inhibitor-activating ATPase MinD